MQNWGTWCKKAQICNKKGISKNFTRNIKTEKHRLVATNCAILSKTVAQTKVLLYNFAMKQEFMVTPQMHGKTIKQFFQQQGYSTTQTKRFKFDGTILVDGTPQTVCYVLQQGQTLCLQTNERLQTPNFAPRPAEILYCDKWLYIANKPNGVAIHPDRSHQMDTLGNMLATHFGSGFQLRIVTRLDKTTSGLVLGALDEVTAQRLNDMVATQSIQKTYIALVEGVVEGEGFVDVPLLRDDANNKTLPHVCGKPSKTCFKALQTNVKRTLLLVEPLTGRTHQIRAHLSHFGHPIVGDALYGAQPNQQIYLHCHKLQFVHPHTGKVVCVQVDAPFALH